MPKGIYPRTKEHRKKISEAKKGKKNGMYGKDPWNKGKKGVQISWNKGLTKETSEHLKKMSDSMKGENNPMYGKIFSDEHLKKMSDSMKGKTPWNKNKTGVMPEPWNKDKTGLFKHSEESKKKISESLTDRIFSDEHKRNISKANKGKLAGENHPFYGICGENHPSWKGGISAEPYCDVWIDKEYKESIKEHYNYQCMNPFCLCNNSDIVLHHINYIKKDCHWKNIIPVCNSSNGKANGDRWFWQEIYERAVERKAEVIQND